MIRARVQYEITQHPKLAAQLPAAQIKILHIALQSHRDALVLEQDNADVLFNTAQVLTSIAEILTEPKRPKESHVQEALQFLQEALELFQRCLVLQELRYTESEQIQSMDMGSDDTEAESKADKADKADKVDKTDKPDEPDEPDETDAEQWAAVIEPVTKDTLVDTAVAQLETLSTLCGLLALDGGNGLAWVEEYSYDLLQTKIAVYVEGTDRHNEVALARAQFVAALSEILYRDGRIDVETYQRELNTAFPASLDLSDNPEGLCAKAEALTSFNSAVAENSSDERCMTLRWQGLATALDSLTAASKLATENVCKVHIARGDSEMARWRLAGPPWNYKVAQEYAATLLKNAQTYYRGAAALARRDGAAEEEEAACKEAFAAALAGDDSKVKQLSVDKVLAVAQDMAEDGLVPGDAVKVL